MWENTLRAARAGSVLLESCCMAAAPLKSKQSIDDKYSRGDKGIFYHIPKFLLPDCVTF